MTYEQIELNYKLLEYKNDLKLNILTKLVNIYIFHRNW